MLPNFYPHHNFEESKCAYLATDGFGKVRIMVDFDPIIADGIRIVTFVGNSIVATVYV